MTITPEELKRHQNSVMLALEVMGQSTTKPEDLLFDLEGVMAGLLLYAANGHHRTAATFLNEVLVPGVERRLAATEAEQRKKK